MSQDDEDIWQNGVKLEPDNDRGEAEDESYSPSSYIPKKVKVNREKEKKREEGAGLVLYGGIKTGRKGDRKRECLNVERVLFAVL